VVADAEIERAFAFVQDAILCGAGGMPAPVFLVFGLAGSGKSTYLTMLGEILSQGEGKYHFPCPGVTVRSLRLDELIDQHRPGIDPSERAMLQRRIRDLTYDFAERHHRDYLANGAWVPATVRETGSAGEAHSFFLVTELVRNNAPFGRIVTIETSGEDYAAVLARMGSVRDPADLPSPLHRVLHRLLDAATGIILLLDPAAADNDQVYTAFLRVLEESVEGRAAHALAAAVDHRLSEAAAQAQPEVASIDDALAREGAAEAARAREQVERTAFGARLQSFNDELAAAPRTIEGMSALAMRWRPLLAELELLIGRIDPAFQARSAENFRIHGRTAANYLLYYEGVLGLLRQEDAFAAAVRQRIELEDARSRDTAAVIARICQERGLREPLHEAFLARWRDRDPGRRLARLRYLAAVVTKADRHPIVYPPSDYPKFKLPASHAHLERLQTWLTLAGGHLRCYNATAIGYAVPRGGRYQPGPGNSFTPVNIVEPVLDMLAPEATA
jgi:hypothetical protein